MPDLPMFGGGPFDAGSNPISTNGIAVSSGATPNTKTSWVEAISSTAYDTSWLLVTLGAGNIGLRFLLDVGVGAAGSETLLVPDLFYSLVTSASPPNAWYLLPLAIPRGTRIALRGQSSTASGAVVAMVHAIAGPIIGPSGLRRVEACGIAAGASALTAIDPGAAANTDSAWVELVAATAFAYRWLMVGFGHSAGVVAASTRWLVDIGVGAAGSETELVPDLFVHGHTGTDTPAPISLCFPASVAAGTRISARARSQSASDVTRDIDVAVWGVG